MNPGLSDSPPPDSAAHTHADYRADIDGLRAVAVLAVVAYHASPKYMPGGYVGVDVFFVISGYLISGILLASLDRGTFSYREFYRRRIRRIFPALVTVLLATLALGWYSLSPIGFTSLGRHVVAAVAFMSNLLLWKEAGYFDATAATKPLLHLWSLGVEEQFYIAWPILLAMAWRKRSGIVTALRIVLALSFIVSLSLTGTHRDAAFYLPLARFWELAIGGWLAWRGMGHRPVLPSGLSHMRHVLSLVGLGAIVVAVFLVNDRSAFPGWWALFPTLGAALVISAGPDALINRAILGLRPVVGVGLISYPLYLWHWPLLVFGRAETLGVYNSKLVSLVCVAVSFVAAWATYRWVEQPIRFGALRRRIGASHLLVAMGVVAGFALLTVSAHGWPSRFPPRTSALLAYQYDARPVFRTDRCILVGNETRFAPECVDSSARTGRPLLLLWGDSHAAMLYAGLRPVADERGIALAQFTSSSCFPILGLEKRDRPLCRSLNDQIADSIASLKPTTVLMAHDWVQSLEENAIPHLDSTVAILRRSGVRRIVLVGPVPHWNAALSTVLSRVMRRSPDDSIPPRLTRDLDTSIAALDRRLEAVAAGLDVLYLSPYRYFCDAHGCRTLAEGSRQELTAFDHAHLTAAAAEELVRRDADQIFGARESAAAKR